MLSRRHDNYYMDLMMGSPQEYLRGMCDLIDKARKAKQEKINAMTEEEYKSYLIGIEIDKAISKYDSYIVRRECPNCGSKLIRGKKNKKMNYRRSWDCQSCRIKFYKMEG